MRRNPLLLPFLIAIALASMAASAHAATLVPVADAYVDASNPTRNFGTSTALRADGSPVLTSYLAFDVHGSGSGATLRVYAETSHSTGVSVRSVADTSWTERGITAQNAPALGPVVAQTGRIQAGGFVDIDVSAAVTTDARTALAITTASSTAVRFSSREGANPPQLLVPPAGNPSPFVITPVAPGVYRATSQVPGGPVYTGTLKYAGESAARDLENAGGGTIELTSGTFDFGTEFWKFSDLHDIVFQGAGQAATIVQNDTSAAGDTEPFNFSGADRVTVRDLTVAARGATRTTSDALDFDRGNDVVVERVAVTASRGRGIVFDGKNSNWTSLRNRVSDCRISGTPGDGIELLASSQNRIEGCTITDVGGHGIQVNKSSPTADQPNKKSSDNVITGNTVTNAGQDGVNVSSGDRNQITGNTITNSSDDVTGRDGIRITPIDSIPCDDNVVSGNTATDNQTPKTQTWGLNITGSLCNRTVVRANEFGGNRLGPVRDLGTGTIYQ